MDEDRLTPQLGRLIDAAKAAAAPATEAGGRPRGDGSGTGVPRKEGWAVLGLDGRVYPGRTLAAVLAASRSAGTQAEALAFAVAGQGGETLLPGPGWAEGARDADPELPVAVKYLGRWVLVALGEVPDP